MTHAYRRRLVDPVIEAALHCAGDVTAGPRASGKTTTAARHARSVVRLDLPDEAAVFRRHPDAALRSLSTPVLLAEWQQVPEVLGAINRAVDTNPAPGRFVGSRSGSARPRRWVGDP